MNRRGFFSALGGVTPLVAAAAPAKGAMVTRSGCNPRCECGLSMLFEELYVGVKDVEMFVVCTNPHCRRHGQKFNAPTIRLEPA